MPPCSLPANGLRLALVLAVLCVLAVPAKAQRFNVHTYQEWDGMPTNPVFEATQDSLGIMWFATRVGVVSFDGQKWATESIHPNAAPQAQRLLHFDQAHQLWSVAAREPLRLSRLRDGQWKTFRYPDFEFQNFSLVGLHVDILPDWN